MKNGGNDIDENDYSLCARTDLEAINDLVRKKMYPNKAKAIRMAVRDLLRKELWDRKGGGD